MARNHLHLGLALLTVSVLLVTLAAGAPKDPQRKIKPDVRSLRGLDTVKLRITNFGKTLESLMPSDSVREIWRKQLVNAGFTVVETGDAPTVGLKAMLVESENAPVGQIATQCPQLIQLASASSVGTGTASGSLNAMIRLGHVSIQIPSRLHFSGSTRNKGIMGTSQ